MRTDRVRIALTWPVICACSCAVLWADDEHEDERVEKLMERTHEGRRSPYGQLRRILAGEAASWPVVERAAAGFEPMRRALVESPVDEIKDSADGYIAAVDALRVAVKLRDEAAVRAAIQGLADSCGDCHFKGGVGGELGLEEGKQCHRGQPRLSSDLTTRRYRP